MLLKYTRKQQMRAAGLMLTCLTHLNLDQREVMSNSSMRMVLQRLITGTCCWCVRVVTQDRVLLHFSSLPVLSLVIQCEAQCQEQHHLHVGSPGRIHSSYLDREQEFLIVSLCVRVDSFIIYCSVYCCVSISHISARLVVIVNPKRCCVQYVPDIILTTSLLRCTCTRHRSALIWHMQGYPWFCIWHL